MQTGTERTLFLQVRNQLQTDVEQYLRKVRNSEDDLVNSSNKDECQRKLETL